MPTTKVNENTDGVKAADTEKHESEGVVMEAPESEIVPVEGPNAKAKAERTAFMHEMVEVMVLPSHDQSDTTRLVSISVQGKSHYMLRGEWTKVPRYVLEILARAKRENWAFNYKKNPDGSTSDTNQMHRILRYPHQFRDPNPEGQKWYDSIKDAHY